MTRPREHYQHALEDLERALLALGHMVDETMGRALWALRNQALLEARAIIRDDKQIDEAAADLENDALCFIALQGPVAGDLRAVSSFIHCSKELERVGDHIKGIAKLILRNAEHPDLSLPTELADMSRGAREMLRDALDAFVQRDPSINQQLQDQDDLIDAYYQRIFRTTLEEMRRDPQLVSSGTYLLWIAHNFERIADRATNIGEYVDFIVTGNRTPRQPIGIPNAAPVPTPADTREPDGGKDSPPSSS